MSILVSKCLAGYCCKYNGGHNRCERVERLAAREQAVLVCPESLGKLPIPRQPCEIVGGDGADVLDGRARVLSKSGEDCTEAYLKGARLTLSLAQAVLADTAVLKANSPSCGCGQVYDGSFSKILRPGDGVTAALLRRTGITVFTEDQVMPDGSLPGEKL